jgi:hypothetical protein
MIEALAQIFALQQRELNEQERHRQRAKAKREREIAAFINSGLPALFTECAQIPLRQNVQQKLYKKVFCQCTYDHCDPRSRQTAEMSFSALSIGGHGPRWWCGESEDSSRMRYLYSDTGSYSKVTMNETAPNGRWLDAFIEYVAQMCDPQAIADKLSEAQANAAIEERFSRNRRRLEAI